MMDNFKCMVLPEFWPLRIKHHANRSTVGGRWREMSRISISSKTHLPNNMHFEFYSWTYTSVAPPGATNLYEFFFVVRCGLARRGFVLLYVAAGRSTVLTLSLRWFHAQAVVRFGLRWWMMTATLQLYGMCGGMIESPNSLYRCTAVYRSTVHDWNFGGAELEWAARSLLELNLSTTQMYLQLTIVRKSQISLQKGVLSARVHTRAYYSPLCDSLQTYLE